MRQRYLAHYGVSVKDGAPGRGSGRYPLGSGEKPQSHRNLLGLVNALEDYGIGNADLKTYLEGGYSRHLRGAAKEQTGNIKTKEDYIKLYYDALKLQKEGKTTEEIAAHFGFIGAHGAPSVSLCRRMRQVAKALATKEEDAQLLKFKSQGLNNTEIARAMKEKFPEGRWNNGTTVANRIKNAEFGGGKGSELRRVADQLVKELGDHKFLDIGDGTEIWLGCKKTMKESAVNYLKMLGYTEHSLPLDQFGYGNDTSRKTTFQLLGQPGLTKQDAWFDKEDIATIGSTYDFATDKYVEPQKPAKVDHSRVFIDYTHEDGTGGAELDGLIELRPGVKDLSLGNAAYAQVRINIDDKYYAKGMARYGDVPEGYDMVFHTNKKDGAPLEKVFKEMKTDWKGDIDWENPFGASIKDTDRLHSVQRTYVDDDGKEKLSAINVVAEEGDWAQWGSNVTVAAQVLSKQKNAVAKEQLQLTTQKADQEFKEIDSLTNPVIRQYELANFADNCDVRAKELKAVGFKDQACKVLLPWKEIKDGEIYAPHLENGTEVALVRYPYSGDFETPKLTVNNKYKGPREVIGNGSDAVGINAYTASLLSGADFDGDTVLVIPLDKNPDFKHGKPLPGLDGFDDKAEYGIPDEFKVDKKLMQKKKNEFKRQLYEEHPEMNKIERAKAVKEWEKKYLHQQEKEGKVAPISKAYAYNLMGVTTNLIMDMTLRGDAPNEDLEKAVKHSMVLIDAEKHYLDYKRSADENKIKALQREYQPKPDGEGSGGPQTLVTKAKSEVRVPEYEELTSRLTPDSKVAKRYKLTPEQIDEYNAMWDAGEHVRIPTGKHVYKWSKKEQAFVDKGPKRVESTWMDETSDAYTLSSGTMMESYFAKYANHMKELGKKARAEARALEHNLPGVDKAAQRLYKDEVKSLKEKIESSRKNIPIERQAQLIANVKMEALRVSNTDWTEDDEKKWRNKLIEQARKKAHSSRERFTITDREWEAIQAHALPSTDVKQLLRHANQDELKQRSRPRQVYKMTSAEIAKAQRMLNRKNPPTLAEVAATFGVSVTTLQKSVAAGA